MTSTAIEQSEQPTLPQLVAASKPELRRLLPDYDRFARVLVTEVRRTPKLAKCTPDSFLAAAFVCAQLGLEPGPLGDAWLIPRWSGKRRANECTFMLGYRGIEKLALRSGLITSIETRTVYEGDDFHVEYGAHPEIRHVPAFRSETPVLWYALARRTDGTPLIQVLTPAQVEARRACSASPDEGPWKDHYDAMARKSCIRAMWQNLPLEARTPEVDRAMDVDEQVLDQTSLRPLEEGRQVDTDTGAITDADIVDQDSPAPAVAGDGDEAGEVEPEPPVRESPSPATPEPEPDPEPTLPPAAADAGEPDRRPLAARAYEAGVEVVDLLSKARAIAQLHELPDSALAYRTGDLDDDVVHPKVLEGMHAWLDEQGQNA